MEKFRLILFLVSFLYSQCTVAQIGINTLNPQNIFHIDAGGDNPLIGLPNNFQQINDLVITSNGKLGIGTFNPDHSSSLEINSISNGFLLPRLTALQMLNIVYPTEGLLIYCIDCKPRGIRLFNGNFWTDLSNSRPDSKYLYYWNFENPVDPLPNLKFEQASGQNNITITIDPLDSSNKVLKTIIPAGQDRTEVYLGMSRNGAILHFFADAATGFSDSAGLIANSLSLGSEIWLSMRILKPQEQNTRGLQPCIVQFGPIGNNVTNASSLGFAQLRIRNDITSYGDRWNWRVFAPNSFTPQSNLSINNNFVVKPYGVWEHFVLHCKYSTGPEGVLEVWKDGIKYITQTGPNAIPFNQIKIKWGLYIGAGNSVPQTLTCYFDDVKIGGENCSYEEISQ
jgi:hypothetical protein